METKARNLKIANLWFCIEWSMASYLAVDCRKSKRNGQYYPRILYEVMLEGGHHDGQILSVKEFDMRGKSIERWGCFSKPWPATDNQVKKVLANTYQIS